jgi:hypothetical protein
VEAIDNFARKAVERTKAVEGYGMYARIYWAVAGDIYGEGLFRKTLANWSIMKKGIDGVLAKYPDPWNINNFANFACVYRDKEKAAELIARIKWPPIGSAWSDFRGYYNCKAWISK